MTQEKKDYAKIFAMMAAVSVVTGQFGGFVSHYLVDHDVEVRTRESAFYARRYVDTVAPTLWASIERRMDSVEYRSRHNARDIDTLYKYKNTYYVQRSY